MNNFAKTYKIKCTKKETVILMKQPHRRLRLCGIIGGVCKWATMQAETAENKDKIKVHFKIF